MSPLLSVNDVIVGDGAEWNDTCVKEKFHVISGSFEVGVTGVNRVTPVMV